MLNSNINTFFRKVLTFKNRRYLFKTSKTRESVAVRLHQLYNTGEFLYQNQKNNYPKTYNSVSPKQKQAAEEGEGKLTHTKQTPNLTKWQECTLAMLMLNINGFNFTLNVYYGKWIYGQKFQVISLLIRTHKRPKIKECKKKIDEK